MARSLDELLVELRVISDEAFHYHCNKKKNDFFSWIHGVFNDTVLANRIKDLTSRREIMQAISDSLGR